MESVLRPIYVATNLVPTTSSPTQGNLRLSFLGMFTSLKNNMRTSSQSKKQVVATILQKLERYWELHLSESSLISAILNLHYKTIIFINEKEKEQNIQHLYRLYETYKSDYIVPKEISSKTLGLFLCNFFLNIINSNLNLHSNSNFKEV